MVRIWFLTEGARKIESWGPGITRLGRRRSWRRVSGVPEIPRRTTAKVVLESWCYTRKGVQRYSRRIAAQFQGIPSGVALGTNSPEGGRGGPWGLELHQARWNSGGPWVLVLYQEDWDRSGPRGGDWIPRNSRRCSARYKFPRWWRRLDLYQQQQGALIPMGLRHLYQGSVGDGKHWITVIQGSHGVIDLSFVYTSSLLVTVYTLSLLVLTVYTVTLVNCLY